MYYDEVGLMELRYEPGHMYDDGTGLMEGRKEEYQ